MSVLYESVADSGESNSDNSIGKSSRKRNRQLHFSSKMSIVAAANHVSLQHSSFHLIFDAQYIFRFSPSTPEVLKRKNESIREEMIENRLVELCQYHSSIDEAVESIKT